VHTLTAAMQCGNECRDEWLKRINV